MKVVVSTNSAFAVKAGGHSSVSGASNIDEGVTIDMSSMSRVEVAHDQQSVLIGTGARWLDVYTALEQYGLSVSGSRASHVGVGGYVLGGGFSWFSNQYGWTCDMVSEYEVVLANGTVVLASYAHHSDLFWALRGGGSSFGIVTSFKLPTLKHPQVYGGPIAFDNNELNNVFASFEKLNREAHLDVHSSGYLSFACDQRHKEVYNTFYLINSRGEASSPAFAGFLKTPSRFSHLRKMNVSTSAMEINHSNDPGYRPSKFTLTFRNDAALMCDIYSIFTYFAGTVDYEPEGRLAMTFQPLTASHIAHSDNALGLSAKDAPLILLSVELRWSSRSTTEYFEDVVRRFYQTMRTLLEENEALHPFVYLNYAARWQDPFAGYGVESVERMKRVRKMYDPDSVFDILQPGAFRF
ncbi:hypothetical protein B0A49_11654 [Cryomyces minteri]|uniref:FAD-binding PCMH-type domain-containing protein n=1 Tax=Cryomyces minteri TaxID=331657 RepID=A0A4U0W8N4_9PEZI|nr:hypothetical protein B0A49_11654 [Cryomyces minteri]